MTMMIANAKCCHEKEPPEVRQLRPCLGCHSHWIHVACGGFCSDCQPSSMDASVRNATSGGNPENPAKIPAEKRRSSDDRSPLTNIKQRSILKKLEDSAGFRKGKENTTTSVGGKRYRRSMTTPPSLDPVIKAPVVAKKASKKLEDKSENNNDTVPAKIVVNTKKRKHSPNTTPKSDPPPAKRSKKISTAPGGTPKKYASEPHAKSNAKRVAKKVLVEVKMAEDGTHNPDRLLFHLRNNQPIDKGETEAEECYEWLSNLSVKQIEDFVDLNGGEKSFFKLWNGHIHKHPCYGDGMLLQTLTIFVAKYAIFIHRSNLYKNFILHLSNLHSFGSITNLDMLEQINQFQTIIKDSIDHPEKYPLIPEKKPIENPYYVPKAMSFDEVQELQKKSKVSSNTSISTSKKTAPKSFWLKKCFRNPVVKNSDVSESGQDREEEDLEKWPRKKAVVTFANEILVEEIRDLHDKSSGYFNSSFGSYDANDLYKFFVSPRQRRGQS